MAVPEQALHVLSQTWHVLSSISCFGDEHVKHVTAVPPQVKQLAEHIPQIEPKSWYSGKQVTQVVAEPEHVKQFELHKVHVFPDWYELE